MSKNQAYKVATFTDTGREIWAKYDPDSDIYELFASQDCCDYLGYAETRAHAGRQAEIIAHKWMYQQ